MIEKQYLLILGVISFFAVWIDIMNVKKVYKYFIFLCILLFALYCGYINFPYSADYSVYQMYFNYASSDFEYKYDPEDIYDYGYVFFHTIIKSLNGDLMTVYFFTCLISLLVYFITFRKYTSYMFIAWYFLFARYFEVQNIIQIRQGLACAFMLLSLKFVYEKKLIPFVIIILIGATIHKSLLVALLIYPISKINWNKVKVIIAILISLILNMIPLTNIIFTIILPAVGIYIPKFDDYLGTVYMTNTSNFELIFRLSTVSFFSYFLLKKKDMPYSNVFLSMLVLGLFFLCIFSDFKELAGRTASIFFLAFTFVPAILLDFARNLKEKILILLFLLLMGGILIIKNYMF